MDCPNDHRPLETVGVQSLQIHRCSTCHGTWCEADELRLLKDKADHGDYCWIDFDLWKDADKFRAGEHARYRCPRDQSDLTTVHYGQSPVSIDVCSKCHGVWLDRGEFDAIIKWLRTKVDSESVNDYLKDVRHEFVEFLTGHKGLRAELHDLGKILYLLELRFAVQHPALMAEANSLPR